MSYFYVHLGNLELIPFIVTLNDVSLEVDALLSKIKELQAAKDTASKSSTPAASNDDDTMSAKSSDEEVEICGVLCKCTRCVPYETVASSPED